MSAKRNSQMLHRYGAVADSIRNEKPDAVPTYGRYLHTQTSLCLMHRSMRRHFSRVTAQPIFRLPGGGLHDSCHCNDLPAPSRASRPMCIVFDELDPIAALEESFEISHNAASRETMFVQHKAIQTENNIDFMHSNDNTSQDRTHDQHSIFRNSKDPSFDKIKQFNLEEDKRKVPPTPSEIKDSKSTQANEEASVHRPKKFELLSERSVSISEDSKRLGINTEYPSENSTPKNAENFKQLGNSSNGTPEYYSQLNMTTEKSPGKSVQSSTEGFGRSNEALVNRAEQSKAPSEKSESKSHDLNPSKINTGNSTPKNAENLNSSSGATESPTKRSKRMKNNSKRTPGYSQSSTKAEKSHDNLWKENEETKKLPSEKNRNLTNNSEHSNTLLNQYPKSNVIDQNATIGRFWKQPFFKSLRTMSCKKKRTRSNDENASRAKHAMKNVAAQTKETKSEAKDDEKTCGRCDILPMMGHQLSRMHFIIDRLEARVDNLQSDVNTIKMLREERPKVAQQHSKIEYDIREMESGRKEIKPAKTESKNYFIVCGPNTPIASNHNGYKTFKIPKAAVEVRQSNQEILYIDKEKYRAYTYPKSQERNPYIQSRHETYSSTDPTQDHSLGQPNQATHFNTKNSSLYDFRNITVIKSPGNEAAFNIKSMPAKSTSADDLRPCICMANKPASQKVYTENQIDHQVSSMNASTQSEVTVVLKQPFPGRQLVINAKKANSSPEPLMPCKCQMEPTAQANATQMLDRQPSSVCQFCADKVLPVQEDLISELVKLIGRQPFTNIMLCILLRADNVYHVNVQLRDSSHVLGCLLASYQAIEKAFNHGIFRDILTYSVIDVRNTIRPDGRPFGIPFEFIARTQAHDKHRTQPNEHVSSRELRVQEFITNVLGIPDYKIRKDAL